MQNLFGDDILFKDEGRVFSYRVGGILVKDGKILLQRPKNDDGLSIIGGHIRYMETTAETLRREFMEEIGIDVEVKELVATAEIFFPWGKKRKAHQVAVYYAVQPIGTLPGGEVIHGKEHFEGKSVDVEFLWVPLGSLTDGSVKVYPEELIPYIVNPPAHPVHIISKQI